jgi:hypothetical protein
MLEHRASPRECGTFVPPTLKRENSKMSKMTNKHGAFAQIVILPGEDYQEFANLLADLKEEWSPQGTTENEKIASIAMSIWRKRRFRTFLQKKIDEVADREAYKDNQRKREYNNMLDLLDEIDSGEPGSVTEERISQKLGPLRAGQIKNLHPRTKYDTDQAWLTAIVKLLNSCLEQLALGGDLKPSTELIDELMSDEAFAEREQSFEERIDAKIDRDIKQLAQIQTMKEIGIGKKRAPVKPQPTIEIEARPLKEIEAMKEVEPPPARTESEIRN